MLTDNNNPDTGNLASVLIDSILPSARPTAILLGLTIPEQLGEPVVQQDMLGYNYQIYSRIMPNAMARIDVLYVDQQPAGSVVFVEIEEAVFHMVGMYVREGYRGRSVMLSRAAVEQEQDTFQTPAEFLLHNVTTDIVNHGRQITLEVMNNNTSAVKLYERCVRTVVSGQTLPAYRLLEQDEVMQYAAMRYKKIGQWHELPEYGLRGVQWSHVPSYNNLSTWSITRVYHAALADTRFKSSVSLWRYCRNKLKLLYSVIRYGNPLALIKYYWLLKRAGIK